MHMSLLYSLKNRFFPPELSRVSKSGDAKVVSECLSRTTVVVIGADLGDPLPFDADQDVVLAIVEAAAEKRSFDGLAHKFSYESQRYLPVFTDPVAAEMFCGAYVSLLGRLHAFRLFRVPGASVGSWLDDNDVLVVNSQGPGEVKISGESSREIGALLGDSGDLRQARFLSVALPMLGVTQTMEFGPEP